MSEPAAAFVGTVAKSVSWTFADFVSYFILGVLAIVAGFAAIVGFDAALPIFERNVAILAPFLALAAYPTGFLLGVVGDVSAAFIRSLNELPRRIAKGIAGKISADSETPIRKKLRTRLIQFAQGPIPPDFLPSGLDVPVETSLSRLLFSDHAESDGIIPADVDSNTMIWLAGAALNLAADQMPAAYAGFQRSVGLLRLVTGILGASLVASVALLFTAFYALLLDPPVFLPGYLIGGLLAAMFTPILYVAAMRANHGLTHRMIQIAVALNANHVRLSKNPK